MIEPLCGKRHGGIERCDLPAGHDKKPRKPLRQRTPEQQEKIDGWMVIKDRKVRAQKQQYGFTFCERCGRRTRHLELHHTEPAGKGGPWTEENAELICAWPESQACHEKEHGKPWPDEKEAPDLRK